MPTYAFQADHPEHGERCLYGFTSAASEEEALAQLDQRAKDRAEAYQRLNDQAEAEGKPPVRVVIPADELTHSVTEVSTTRG